MTKLRSWFSNVAPRGIRPLLKRQLRWFDRIRGLSASKSRAGVVLMLHVGRCGSTVLANQLAQHDQVFWDGKLPRKAYQLYGDGARHLDVGTWTKAQFSMAGDRFYGFEFKILADQYPAVFDTTTTDFLTECRKIGVTHYILLARRNTLRHVVSHYASKSRGSWHAAEGEKVQKKVFTLDVTDITTGRAPGRCLVDYLQEVDAAHTQVRDILSGENFMELEYETDIDEAGATSAYQRICGFLDIPASEVNIKNRKMNPFPLETVLENFDEIETALFDTQFAWMTTD